MKKRIIVDVSEKFHRDLKQQAAREQRTIKQIVLEAVCAYLLDRSCTKG